MAWPGTVEELLKFMEWLNSIHLLIWTLCLLTTTMSMLLAMLSIPNFTLSPVTPTAISFPPHVIGAMFSKTYPNILWCGEASEAEQQLRH